MTLKGMKKRGAGGVSVMRCFLIYTEQNILGDKKKNILDEYVVRTKYE
jgi:hypothetical protein